MCSIQFVIVFELNWIPFTKIPSHVNGVNDQIITSKHTSIISIVHLERPHMTIDFSLSVNCKFCWWVCRFSNWIGSRTRRFYLPAQHLPPSICSFFLFGVDLIWSDDGRSNAIGTTCREGSEVGKVQEMED